MIKIRSSKPSLDKVRETLIEEYHSIASKLLRGESKTMVWLRLCEEYHKGYYPHLNKEVFIAKMGSKPEKTEPKEDNKVTKFIKRIKRSTLGVPKTVQLSLF